MRRNNNRRKEKFMLFSVMVMFLAIIAGGAAAIIWLIPTPIEPNMEIVTFHERHDLNPDNIHIILDGELLDINPARVINEDLYLDVDFVNFTGPHIFWEPDQDILTISTLTEFMRMTPDSYDVYINLEEGLSDFTFRRIGDTAYLPLTFIEHHFDIRVSHTELDMLIIHQSNNEIEVTTTSNTEVHVRHLPDIQEYIAETVDIGTALYIAPLEIEVTDEEGVTSLVLMGYEEEYLRVITPNGTIGFVAKSDVSDSVSTLYAFTNQPAQRPRIEHSLMNEPLNIAWDLVTNRDANYLDSRRVLHQGVNIMAPKWLRFERTNYSGTLENISSHGYVQWAHNNGMQVWPLLFDYQDPEVATRILSQAHLRDYVITQLIDIALEFNFDGIMIDIEGSNSSNQGYFLQFLRELSPIMREHDLVYSIAVFVPAPWRLWYDHTEIGRVVDYLAIMAYDQNDAGSANNVPTATVGPNASIGFVRDAVNYLTSVMDSDRVILGLPFYTRIWYITYNEDNERRYSESLVGTQWGLNYFRDAGIEMFWSEHYGSYYSSFVRTAANGDETLVRSWIENERSIAVKTELVHEFDLAGVAGWQRTLATNAVWSAIDDVLSR